MTKSSIVHVSGLENGIRFLFIYSEHFNGTTAANKPGEIRSCDHVDIEFKTEHIDPTIVAGSMSRYEWLLLTPYFPGGRIP